MMKPNKKKNRYDNVYDIRKRSEHELMQHKAIHEKHATRHVNALYPSHRTKRMALYVVLLKRVFAHNGREWTYEPIE